VERAVSGLDRFAVLDLLAVEEPGCLGCRFTSDVNVNDDLLVDLDSLGVQVGPVNLGRSKPVVNVIKRFSSSLTTRPNKLDGLSLETLSSLII